MLRIDYWYWYNVSKSANICLHIESSNVQFVNQLKSLKIALAMKHIV